MTPLDNLTVCVTTFHRPAFLDRALVSVRAAGIRRVVVAVMEPDAETWAVIERHRLQDWLSFDVASVVDDIGCNDTWQLAAYHARTKRIIILHDDDTLHPEFGSVYSKTIAPFMDREPCFATWRAELLYMDGRREPTDFWHGPTRIMPSRELAKVLQQRKRLSISPVISVFDRETVIHACKEASENLVAEGCYHHPGMLLGTELVVYIRHVQRFPRWFFVDKVLSYYGSHGGSGTIIAQNQGDLSGLTYGYDLARTQAEKPQPPVKPRIIFTYFDNPLADPEGVERNRCARLTWDHHFSQGIFVEMPITAADLTRTSEKLQDTRVVPFVRDIFDWGVLHAMPEDIVVYCNRDVGLSAPAAELIIAGVEKGRGVTCCPRRRLTPKPGRMYKTLVNCCPDGGFDMFAVTPKWWGANRKRMPDMLIGREGWDTVFRTLAEEWADNKPRLARTLNSEAVWKHSKAYTDLVCWHQQHASPWQAERLTASGQRYNRELARTFFLQRNSQDMIKILS